MQTSPVLFERAEEQAGAIHRRDRGHPCRVGALRGSRGLGRDRKVLSLLAEARLRAGAAGMTATARGSEIERSFSYGVVRQLFERLVAQSDQTGASRPLAAAAAHAGRLFSAEPLPGQLRASEDDAFALCTGSIG